MSASTDPVIAALEEAGALRSGHFQLSSGLHSDRYCQCALVCARPDLAGRLGSMMSERWRSERIDVVLAPALGGIVWGYELARSMGGRVRSLFAERGTGGAFELRRGFGLERGERVLLAEDVVTTGGSVSELVPLVLSTGAVVAGFAAIADRSRGRFVPGARFEALVRLDFETYEPSACPQCAAGRAIDKPGSRPGGAGASARAGAGSRSAQGI